MEQKWILYAILGLTAITVVQLLFMFYYGASGTVGGAIGAGRFCPGGPYGPRNVC